MTVPSQRLFFPFVKELPDAALPQTRFCPFRTEAPPLLPRQGRPRPFASNASLAPTLFFLSLPKAGTINVRRRRALRPIRLAVDA